jgi:hypothetical protein
MVRCGSILLAFAMVVATAAGAVAQQATTPAPSSPPPADQVLLKPEQLEALVAPIALYPDELLANVLAAATYPLEVVQADRWLKERKSLKGDALKKQVDGQSWDDSVKALAGTPDVIAMMSDKIDWTKNLGDAVLAQQPDLMDAVQRLRSKAYDNKKLVTTKQQKVSVQTQENKQAIVIESAVPDTMYVPYYDPVAVYGTWPYAEYPPYYFAYPPYIGAGVIAAGIAFGAGWAIGRWGNYWGGGCNWGNRNLYVNHFNRTTNIGNSWQHNPAHRQGVRYNNSNVAQRFGNGNSRAGAADRMDFRGRNGQQVLNPGQNRPAGGDRAGAGDRGDRAGVSDRAKGGADRAKGGGDRAGVSDRAKGGGDRAKGGGNRAGVSDRTKSGGDRAKAANRSSGAARGGGNALNVSSGRAAVAASARGQASLGARGGGAISAGGGGYRGGGGGGFSGGGGRGGGGGFSGGGGGRGGGGGGGRRSDIALKHDIVLLGHLSSGLGYYRFSYLGSDKAYVGVIAQEVQGLMPQAVTRGADGYLRVYYDKLGLKLQTYRDWLAGGARIPAEVMP